MAASKYLSQDCPRCGNPRDTAAHFGGKCPMTDELWEALFAFKVANGYLWKSKLTALWRDGAPAGLLATLKEVLGPIRLYKVKFPKKG